MRDKENEEVFIKDINGIAEVDEVIVVPIDIPELKTSTVQNDDNYERENVQTGGEEVHVQEEKSESNTSSQVHKTKTGKTVRVDIDRLDVLMNLVSELIIIKTRLAGLSGSDNAQTYNETIEYLDRITTSLNDAVMKVRMVPVEMVFNRFPRMIRTLPESLEKRFSLICPVWKPNLTERLLTR